MWYIWEQNCIVTSTQTDDGNVKESKPLPGTKRLTSEP